MRSSVAPRRWKSVSLWWAIANSQADAGTARASNRGRAASAAANVSAVRSAAASGSRVRRWK